MPATMTQGVSGTATRSSGLTGPHTNSTSPSGRHWASPEPAPIARNSPAATTAENNLARMSLLLVANPPARCRRRSNRGQVPPPRSRRAPHGPPGQRDGPAAVPQRRREHRPQPGARPSRFRSRVLPRPRWVYCTPIRDCADAKAGGRTDDRDDAERRPRDGRNRRGGPRLRPAGHVPHRERRAGGSSLRRAGGGRHVPRARRPRDAPLLRPPRGRRPRAGAGRGAPARHGAAHLRRRARRAGGGRRPPGHAAPPRPPPGARHPDLRGGRPLRRAVPDRPRHPRRLQDRGPPASASPASSTTPSCARPT